MYHDKLFCLDLAKKSIQGCLLDKHNQERFNRPFSRQALIAWLSRQKPLTVVMEACATAHYWARVVERLGHRPLLVPTRSANRYREGHKTNATDAVAVGTAARQARTRFVAPKTIEQQEMQSVERIREHVSDDLTATNNLMRALIAEFGLGIPKGISAFKRRVVELLEDTGNDIPAMLRIELFNEWQRYQQLEQRLKEVTHTRDRLCKHHEACLRLMQLGGVGPVNAVGLYLSLGDRGSSFKNGRDAATSIGTTPKQYSTGDGVTIIGISKVCANKRLRSNLIQGARSVIKALKRREPKNAQEAWLKQLIERRGEGRAAVAFASKTIRLAWAMLHYGDEFKLHPNLA